VAEDRQQPEESGQHEKDADDLADLSGAQPRTSRALASFGS
jgi:hypothetical protein